MSGQEIATSDNWFEAAFDARTTRLFITRSRPLKNETGK